MQAAARKAEAEGGGSFSSHVPTLLLTTPRFFLGVSSREAKQTQIP